MWAGKGGPSLEAVTSGSEKDKLEGTLAGGGALSSEKEDRCQRSGRLGIRVGQGWDFAKRPGQGPGRSSFYSFPKVTEERRSPRCQQWGCRPDSES